VCRGRASAGDRPPGGDRGLRLGRHGSGDQRTDPEDALLDGPLHHLRVLQLTQEFRSLGEHQVLGETL